MRSLELFAGCGGLALGLARAGFHHDLVVERDQRACDTLRFNRRRGIEHVADWEIWSGDVCDLDYADYEGRIDLLSGGPPCQPFSIGGKHLGPDDQRNMWPEAARAVREVMPRAFLFENVRGLLRENFADYLDYILLQLGWPELEPKEGEEWLDHRDRLTAYSKQNKGADTYRVRLRGIDAADYGAGQRRHRVIIIGVRSDVTDAWHFPEPTHSAAALAWAKEGTGEYWSRYGLPDEKRPTLSREERGALRRLPPSTAPDSKPWVTVRDKFEGLPEASPTGPDWNHVQHPGARSYKGHTGCHLDEPAKALKAGMHGVPGGENILALDDGSVRYFTVREMARLQGLPDDFVVTGNWNHVTRQLGNAVPAEVGEALGNALKTILEPCRAATAVDAENSQAGTMPMAAE